MSLSIDDIADTAITIIEGSTPDYEPTITYRALSGDIAIEDTPAHHHPDLTTREFQCWPGLSVRFSSWNGCTLNLWADLNVAMRYQVQINSPGAWLRKEKLIGTDVLRITHALNERVGGWTGTTLRMINEPLVVVNQMTSGDIWILTMTYPVNLDLAA